MTRGKLVDAKGKSALQLATAVAVGCINESSVRVKICNQALGQDGNGTVDDVDSVEARGRSVFSGY